MADLTPDPATLPLFKGCPVCYNEEECGRMVCDPAAGMGVTMNNILFVGEHSRTYDVQWHSHDHWELVYCTGGQGTFQFDDGSAVEYKTGDAVAIPPNLRHTNRSPEGFTNIHLRMSDPAFTDRAAFLVTDDEEWPLQFTFLQARYYYLSDIRKRELVLDALGDLIVSYMTVFRNNSAFSAPVEQIRDLIIRNYTQPDFALDEALRKLPFHYDYLRKLFRREMGMTPLEYMTHLRMKKAENMLGPLWSHGFSVTYIAMSCGYENALYFSRVFKNHFGCSPTDFSKNYRQQAQQT